jgi:hypothetical protein
MKEVSAYQIAAAVAGHPSGPGSELRLLGLFHDAESVEVQPEATEEPLPRAA